MRRYSGRARCHLVLRQSSDRPMRWVVGVGPVSASSARLPAVSEPPAEGSTSSLVRRASKDEAVAVARVLTRAFIEDPIERWCLACDDLAGLIELELLQVTRQLASDGSLWGDRGHVGRLSLAPAWYQV